MVRLFLSEADLKPVSDGVGDAATMWISLLERLESGLWSRLMSGGLSEARLWLSDSVSSFTSISSRHQVEVFMKLLRSEQINRDLATQLLRMIFERKPEKAGSILARKSSVLEKFFDGHPKRILHWFSHFSNDGGLDHKRGARALSQFAFLNRDICWDELDWKGKHGQSPVVVAAKPYYLLDLDIQRTIENFIENVPEFWLSSEFSESLKDGEIISIDENFFVDFFFGLMYKDDSEDVWNAVSEFLEEEPFSLLCRRLLITLGEQEFCVFLDILGKYINPRTRTFDVSQTSSWLELLIHKSIVKLNDLILLNAVISQGHKLLRLVHDEDFEDAREKIMEVLSELISLSNSVSTLSPLLNECCKLNLQRAMKLLGLQSWVIYYILSQACRSSESWESILTKNRISFKKSNEYGLLEEKEVSEKGLPKKRKQGKNKKSRKKIKEQFSHDNSYDDDLLEAGVVRNWLDRSWLLSTDDFSVSWPSSDLPEHLAKVCFSRWMKFVYNRWRDGV